MTQTQAAEEVPPVPPEEKKPVDEKIVKLEALEREGTHIAALIKVRDEKREIAATDRATANESQKEADDADEDVEDALVKLYHISRDQDIPPLFRPEPAVPENGAWRVVTLASLAEPAIKPGILTRLAGAGIETMGSLCDFQAKNGDMWNRDIKGVGKVALDNIAEATTAFWERWATTQGQAAETAAGGALPPAEGERAPSPDTPPASGGPGEATEPPEPAGGLEPTS